MAFPLDRTEVPPQEERQNAITIPVSLYTELIDWFEKFNESPILHDQGLPQRLNDAAYESMRKETK